MLIFPLRANVVGLAATRYRTVAFPMPAVADTIEIQAFVLKTSQ
jgi:hypothetical protein